VGSDLAVGLRAELDPGFLKLSLELRKVLNDAVVDKGKLEVFAT
jgi:hypothetical protein